jgi:hypothetical protein
VILATGLQKLRGLDGAGATLPGVEQGIHSCAASTSVDTRRRRDTSSSSAVATPPWTARAARCGPARAKVTVAYRRSRSEMPAIAEEVEQAEHEGVDFLFLRAPLGFEGDARVSGVVARRGRARPADESGRRRPVVSERSEVLACDHVLLALGQSADLSKLAPGLGAQRRAYSPGR